MTYLELIKEAKKTTCNESYMGQNERMVEDAAGATNKEIQYSDAGWPFVEIKMEDGALWKVWSGRSMYGVEEV